MLLLLLLAYVIEIARTVCTIPAYTHTTPHEGTILKSRNGFAHAIHIALISFLMRTAIGVFSYLSPSMCLLQPHCILCVCVCVPWLSCIHIIQMQCLNYYLLQQSVSRRYITNCFSTHFHILLTLSNLTLTFHLAVNNLWANFSPPPPWERMESLSNSVQFFFFKIMNCFVVVSSLAPT